MTPFNRRILVEPENADNDSPLLREDDHLALKGKVVAVGDACTFVKPGDEIVFVDFGVDTVEVDGKKLRFMLEDDRFLLAKV